MGGAWARAGRGGRGLMGWRANPGPRAWLEVRAWKGSARDWSAQAEGGGPARPPARLGAFRPGLRPRVPRPPVPSGPASACRCPRALPAGPTS